MVRALLAGVARLAFALGVAALGALAVMVVLTWMGTQLVEQIGAL